MSAIAPGLSNKQRILKMMERWPEDISFDKAMYNIHLLRSLLAGLADCEAGRVIEHDELFDKLERRCDEEENARSLVKPRRKQPGVNPKVHRRSGIATNGKVLRVTPKKVRKSAS